MAKSAFQKKQAELQGSTLCKDHAEYYEMKPKDYILAELSDDPEEPIQCECCSMAAMRRAGAI